MALDEEQFMVHLRAIREAVGAIENMLTSEGQGPADPYERRKQVLGFVYEQGGAEKPELMQVLREAGAAYQWIGQQVKMGYLELPSKGEARYKVTRKAIRELHIGEDAPEEEAVFTSMAEEAFAEDWDSEEDSVYDRL